MDFWGAVRTLRRRWYIALPAAVTAVAVAAGVFLSIPTRYQSSGVMVLTSPASGGTFSEKLSPEDAVQVNPLLAFDGSLTTTAQILAQILADPKTRKESLGLDKESTENFTAAGGGMSGPFLFVTADGSTPEAAERLVTTVMEFATKELDKQQTALKAPASTFITSQVIVNPTAAEAQIGGKVRYAGAAFVLLMLLTTAATFGGDSVLNHLRRRREAREGKPAPTEAPEAAAPAPAPVSAPAPAPTGPPPPPPANGAPRRPPGPPVRRPQPTASEQTVKIAAPGPRTGRPGAPAWPTGDDQP
ncbi:capsular polysaccharide biosynthesis protein [Saccharothrix saharensis]|uniref:Capsular polysaccharide biosynthesis protein n=1 Tax=Saccharothrix saharensis TaxID=571190 RepID=A0A543J9U2_9PSEU|nr:hypothetical protein [Saccharothrix saharensis]TQM79598.1 capsular polysaccharide biosynthesis protein [Saccharothrix saharensis]